ncbi:MAG TPA: DUF5050 domain-containing protein [Oscillospiraceae bacterium]|nr:DUF5050 domain-containing protein [Oscillospiraceae bacterium]HPS35532.1 DUF5050 domain-containing protein [Oscillospiraceae bacterium]
MSKNNETTLILFIMVFSMLSGCSSLPQQSSASQSVASEEAPNVLEGWIYDNDCFDGSYGLCRFNLDGEVVKIHDDNAATIVLDKNYIYYSTMPDSEDSLDIYRIKPDGTGREKIVDNAIFREDFYVHNGWLYYQQEYYISGYEGGLSRVRVDGGDVQKIGESGIFMIYKDMIFYTSTNEQEETIICKMNLDGSNPVTLCIHEYESKYDNFPYSMFIVDDWIYFEDSNPIGAVPTDKRYIYKLSINGGEPIPIVETVTSGIRYHQGYLYYSDDRIEQDYRMELKTGKIEQLKSFNTYKSGYYGDWYWYFERSGEVYEKTLNKVKIESLVMIE